MAPVQCDLVRRDPPGQIRCACDRRARRRREKIFRATHDPAIKPKRRQLASILGGRATRDAEKFPELTATCSVTQIPERLSPWVSLGKEEDGNYQPEPATPAKKPEPEVSSPRSLFSYLVFGFFFLFPRARLTNITSKNILPVFVILIPQASLHPLYLCFSGSVEDGI